VTKSRSIASASLAEVLLAECTDAVVAFDLSGACTHWSDVADRMFGRTTEDALGRPIAELFSRTADVFARVLDGERVRLEDRPYPSGSGAYDAIFVPWRDVDTGLAVGVVGMLRDATVRREHVQLLRESESRFRTMADSAPVLLWMADTDALCTFFNQTWLQFTGRSLADEWGIGWAEGVHFEDLQRCVDTYMAAFAARRPFEMEYRLRRADGQYRWVLDRGTPRRAPDGRFAGYIGSCVDITDRKDLETDLVRRVRVHDEFLSIASHELKTPLTALRLQLDSLARSIERRAQEHLASGRLATNASEAIAQVGRLTALIERLLDISRVAEGRLTLVREQTDLVALVRGVLDGLRETARAAGCEVAVTAPPTLAGRWDRLRLEQVLTNLVANAFKFGAHKPVAIEIAGDGDEARVAVIDAGIGVEARDQARIFERFERGVSARHFGGLGLGLWVAKQIVDAHEGRLSVASAPGEGATFTLALPRDLADAPPGATP
jgi:PAS domain S-box-containing protein